jgi:hypothetical protein
MMKMDDYPVDGKDREMSTRAWDSDASRAVCFFYILFFLYQTIIYSSFILRVENGNDYDYERPSPLPNQEEVGHTISTTTTTNDDRDANA